ncbi:MAG: hypothetical protein KIT84_32675 [Labilithrix sp.]|nr:hypothetical protein [Labilithrix sp.]MCW5815830.1 hypothetical protein [Labilithrix sp.]
MAIPPGTSCPAPLALEGETFTAPRAKGLITIDGELEDWACAQFFNLDSVTATHILGHRDIPNVYAFSVAWDEHHVYVAARVTDPTPGKNGHDYLWENDGVEIYLGNGPRTGSYSPLEYQWIIDWNNRARTYRPDTREPDDGFERAVRTTDTGYHVEARIASRLLARDSLAAGITLGFALAANEEDETARRAWLIWQRGYDVLLSCPECCGAEDNQGAHCNTRYLNDLVLAE